MAVKRLTYQFIAVFLSVLMLAFSGGASFDVHFCNENVSSVSFSGKTKSCSERKKTCCKKQKEVHQKMSAGRSCCSTQTISARGIQQAEPQQHAQITINQVENIVEKLSFVEFSTPVISKKEVKLINYYSPLLVRNIPVLIEQFRC